MSQRDLARTLRDARPVAPPELRERVRLVAAQAAPPRRQLVTWRNALVVAAVVAAAVVTGVLATRPAHHVRQQSLAGEAVQRAAVPGAASARAHTPLATLQPNTKRIQRYSTSLELRVRDAAALSDASKRAVAIAHALGGYEQRDRKSTRLNSSH